MQPDLSPRNIVVLGGTGAIGSAVLRALATRGHRAAFTYLRNEDKARALSAEYGHRGARIDLARAGAVREFFAAQATADVVIHCAAISDNHQLSDIDDAGLQQTLAVNASSALWAAQHLAAHVGGGDIVLVGALDRNQSLPLPVDFAASQGMLSAMAMALAHELGPRGFRINMVALGVMGRGLSEQLAMQSRKDYERFSALRRVGTPEQAAQAICWLALENTYLNGKVVPVNGGI